MKLLLSLFLSFVCVQWCYLFRILVLLLLCVRFRLYVQFSEKCVFFGGIFLFLIFMYFSLIIVSLLLFSTCYDGIVVILLCYCSAVVIVIRTLLILFSNIHIYMYDVILLIELFYCCYFLCFLVVFVVGFIYNIIDIHINLKQRTQSYNTTYRMVATIMRVQK